MRDEPGVSFAVKPVLRGEKVTLRPFRLPGDAAALRAMLQDPELIRLTGSRHEPGEGRAWNDSDEKAFQDWYSSRNDQPGRLDLAVVDVVTGECVGELVLNEWSPPDRSCNFRVALARSGRDRGLGTEAIRLFLDYGFGELALHRISLEVLAFNPRARRVYDKVGFTAEGVRREAHRWGGEWVDVTIMAVLAAEWERHRGRPGD